MPSSVYGQREVSGEIIYGWARAKAEAEAKAKMKAWVRVKEVTVPVGSAGT